MEWFFSLRFLSMPCGCGIDVLSNREVVDIVASSPARSSAARSLVESAVRAWKFKYPTSKIDDCAAVCLFLTNSDDVAASSSMSENTSNIKTKETSIPTTALDQSDTKKSRKGKDTEEAILKEHVMADGNSTSAEDWDEWSALEGVARVNTLLTLPRFHDTGLKRRSVGPKAKK